MTIEDFKPSHYFADAQVEITELRQMTNFNGILQNMLKLHYRRDGDQQAVHLIFFPRFTVFVVPERPA